MPPDQSPIQRPKVLRRQLKSRNPYGSPTSVCAAATKTRARFSFPSLRAIPWYGNAAKNSKTSARATLPTCSRSKTEGVAQHFDSKPKRRRMLRPRPPLSFFAQVSSLTERRPQRIVLGSPHHLAKELPGAGELFTHLPPSFIPGSGRSRR